MDYNLNVCNSTKKNEKKKEDKLSIRYYNLVFVSFKENDH